MLQPTASPAAQAVHAPAGGLAGLKLQAQLPHKEVDHCGGIGRHVKSLSVGWAVTGGYGNWHMCESLVVDLAAVKR